jgi:class 3 adenylate cyclase
MTVLVVVLLIGLCPYVAYQLSQISTAVRLAENHFLDARLALFAVPRAPATNIVVVTITDETLAGLPYRSPLDRGLLSELLSTLEAKGVAVIGLNVLIDRATEPDKDAALHSTLRRLKIPIVVATMSEFDGVSQQQALFSLGFLESIPSGLAVVYRDALDETVREQLLRRVEPGQVRLGFAAAVAAAAGAEPPPGERAWIDYRVSANSEPSFPVYPAHVVESLPSSHFTGRIVLVGADLGLVGRYRTPLTASASHVDGYMPGVLIAAHALSQILEGRRVTLASGRTVVALLVTAALFGVLVAALPIALTAKVILAAVLVPIAWLAGFAVYMNQGPLVPLVSPTISFGLAVIGSFTWQWRSENERRRFIHRAFGRFLSPTVVDQLMREPERLAFSGESRELTFLFTDIHGFTSLTEQVPPDVLVRVVNTYLDEACGIVVEHGGTIDKIVGDALHIMFNAPLEQADHAQRAVECALALDAWAERFCARQQAEGIPLGHTRIGVNTGRTVVGNFGGATRFDYTAHGNAVNTAARLESVNDRLGTRICVSEDTVRQCTGIAFRPIANLVLKGRTDGTEAFLPVSADDVDRELHQAYESAYGLLREGSVRARAAFEELCSRFPEDPLARLHQARLAGGATDTTMIVRRK